ncbi:Rossmann-fold NAD(P)-binding domain-containing protein [Paraburkholderia domus]|uniref:hypothetical protein n=1 Tax=Paraburkholderia domus TaxID=2793075 RepID=UPI001B248315|nr:hypothetical protein [Paraburkholderia domus]CAE6825647.1 hypothetical protein R75483_06461 [Paraburkholderia domus]
MTKRIAVVSGGMGEVNSTKLHDAAYDVPVTHSSANAGVTAWLRSMQTQGGSFRAYTVDVADYDSRRQCAEKIRQEILDTKILRDSRLEGYQ